MERAEKSPEFDLARPLQSATEVARRVVLHPREFFRNFSPGGPVREAALFVLLVAAVAAVLRVVVVAVSNAVFGELVLANVGLTVLLALLVVVLAPAAVGAAAGVYLLSIKTFVGPEADFRGVYRMLAYASAPMLLGWVPVLEAFIITYVLMILMGIGIRTVYQTTFITAVVTALASYVPVAIAIIWLQVAVVGRVFG